MYRILNQKSILKIAKQNEKILEHRMRVYTTKHLKFSSLYNKINHSPKEQLNELGNVYRKYYPKQLNQQNKVLLTHLKRIPNLIQQDLKYKGSVKLQQRLIRTDYIEQSMGEFAWRTNVDRRRNYQLPFKQYASLIYEHADYKYLEQLSQKNPDFKMLDTRLATLNSSHRNKLPHKFFERNLSNDTLTNKSFIHTEQRYIKQYKQSLVDSIKGSTLAKKHLYSLVNGRINPKKLYKLRHWTVIKSESNLENPQQIFTYAKSLTHADTSKALTAFTKSAEVAPALNYTVKSNISNHHLLPKQVIVDTLQANGLNKQADKVNKNATDWVQRKEDGVIISPSADTVKAVIHKSSIQYQGIRAFLHDQSQNMNTILQQAGINPPSDNTKSSNKKHTSNIQYTHISSKHHHVHTSTKSLKQKELNNNMNHIER